MTIDIDRCYTILGVGYGASADELKQAYRDLVREWHPDKHQHDSRKQRQAEEKLKLINIAYDRLKDYKPAPPARFRGARASAATGSGGPAAYEAQWQRASATGGPRPAEEDEQTVYARAVGHYEEGRAQFEAGEWTEAVSNLMQAVCLKPNIGDAYLLLGRAYTEMKMPAKAASSYKQVIRFQPANLEAHNELARSYLAMESPKEAVWTCSQVLKKRPKNVAIRTTLGLAYRKLGRYAQSQEALEGAIELDEAYAPARYELGETYLAMGRKEDARAVYAALKPLDTDLAVQLLLSIVGS
jgi:tetratricopeptide (TPR) repeat protein